MSNLNFGFDSSTFSKTNYKKQSSQQFADLQSKEVGFPLKESLYRSQETSDK